LASTSLVSRSVTAKAYAVPAIQAAGASSSTYCLALAAV
jgi:hypothetical protein